MKNLKQKFLMTCGILLTFGLVAAARPALPSNAQQILTGEANEIVTVLEDRAGGEDALAAQLGFDDDAIAMGDVSLERVLERALETNLISDGESRRMRPRRR